MRMSFERDKARVDAYRLGVAHELVTEVLVELNLPGVKSFDCRHELKVKDERGRFCSFDRHASKRLRSLEESGITSCTLRLRHRLGRSEWPVMEALAEEVKWGYRLGSTTISHMYMAMKLQRDGKEGFLATDGSPNVFRIESDNGGFSVEVAWKRGVWRVTLGQFHSKSKGNGRKIDATYLLVRGGHGEGAKNIHRAHTRIPCRHRFKGLWKK